MAKDEKDLEKKSSQKNSEQEDKIKRKFIKLSDYKAKNKIKETEFKKQKWFGMSPAFKDVTKLPGLPLGHVICVYGKSDTGKSTMLIEAAVHAQEEGILPVLIITENKWSWKRAETMGLIKDDCIAFDNIQTIEDGIAKISETIKSQEKGELNYDIIFLWDSIGTTPSKAEWEAQQEDGGKTAMMVTARILRAQITRYIGPKINATRKKEYPYTNSLFIVNHAYTAPPKPPSTISTLEPYGGDGVYLASSLVFRQGGIMSRSSKVTATKDGAKVAFGIKSALVVEKNHITNVAARGNILCTDHGFISDDKKIIDEYKNKYKNGWDLEYDKYWDSVSLD